MFQWLGLCVLTAKDLGWILGQETKILCSAWCSQKKRKKKKKEEILTHITTQVLGNEETVLYPSMFFWLV